MESGRAATGFLLGKFLPPHRGHQFLIEFARAHVERLYVLVCTLARDPIPGRLRYQWMQAAFPDVHLIHHSGDIPQTPEEHPDFWDIWRDTIMRHVPERPDLVFASEDYGWRLAEVLGARYVPVDHGRRNVPAYAWKIRRDPMRHWNDILPSARPYFVRRICLFGPEATGKSTLAQRLAAHFRTVCVHEYARGLLDFKGGHCHLDDIPRIASGQAAAEDALAEQANCVLICDTDLLTTTLWSDILFGDCPAWIRDEAERRRYQLYLLTDVDQPLASEQTLYMPGDRRRLFERFAAALDARGRPHLRLRGPWDRRFDDARGAVQRVIDAPPPAALAEM